MNQQIAIKELLPNPFRNMEHYKIQEKKVEQLIQSFETTGVWPVIIGRKTGNGKIELAFGHHRKAAAEKLYGKNHQIEIILMDLSDEDMLKFMANENQQDFASSFVIEMETVHAVVEAFAAGKIKLDKPEAKGITRRAPSFMPISRKSASFRNSERCAELAYNAKTIGVFLGWMKPSGDARDRITYAINARELIEEGHLTVAQLEGLTDDACQRMIREVGKERDERNERVAAAKEYVAKLQADLENAETDAQRKTLTRLVWQANRDLSAAEAEMKSMPRAVAETISSHERDKRKRDKQAQEIAQISGDALPKELPELNDVVNSLRIKIDGFLTIRTDLGRKLHEVMRYRDQIDEGMLAYLIMALERLTKRSRRYVLQLTNDDQKQLPAEDQKLIA